MKRAAFAAAAAALILSGYVLRNGWTHGVSSHFPKRAVQCPRSGRVLVVAGQSLAANTGQLRTAADGYAFDGENCYPLADPIAGGDSEGGSIWPETASKLPGTTIVISGAVTGSSIAQWTQVGKDGQSLSSRLRRRVEALARRGHYQFVFLFMQGGTDAIGKMPARTYLAHLLLLHRTFADIPHWLIDRETDCGQGDWPPIDQARFAFGRLTPGVVIGPYMDDIRGDARDADHCHLTGLGQRLFAERIGGALTRLHW